jgi:hypothetical protein
MTEVPKSGRVYARIPTVGRKLVSIDRSSDRRVERGSE